MLVSPHWCCWGLRLFYDGVCEKEECSFHNSAKFCDDVGGFGAEETGLGVTQHGEEGYD